MLWVPGVDEIPLGFAEINDSTNSLGFIIEKIGEGTSALFELKENDKVGLRGPFGKCFNLSSWSGKNIILVGGGVGMAPLIPLITCNDSYSSLEIIYGAQNKESLSLTPMINDLKPTTAKFHVTTDDGSDGFHGTIVDFFKENYKNLNSGLVLAAGPEGMLFALHNLLLKEFSKADWEFSLCERYIKCAIGICGSCSLDDLGLRLCYEGPVLGKSILSQLSSFGHFGRNLNGSKRNFSK